MMDNHTDTSRSGDLVEPLFSCSQDGCREECSYPADMLALHNAEPICEDCYHDLPFKSQAPDPDDEQETLIWHDLPRFVPSFARRIEALEAENERLNGLILATADHWLALQCDHSVEWAGAIDTAMEAACDEIRRLSAALGEKQ